MAPVSNAVAEAAHKAVELLRVPSRLTPSDFFDRSNNVRRLFGQLIGAEDPDRIAIVPSVSYALAAVARNTPLSDAQNVVVIQEQFPSNVYTWKRACETTGATLRTVPEPTTNAGRGHAWNDALLAAIDERTAVVTIPQLHWTDGTKYDLEAVGRRVRSFGARLIVDGTQSIGALPFDIAAIQPDAVICAGYKWLMGPYSIGVAYFGPPYDEGVPVEENWITRRGSEDFAGLVRYRDAYQPGAVRYDVGERSNFVLMPMLEAGLSQVLGWGPAAIQAYCQDLVSEPIRTLRDLGCWVETDGWRAAHLFGVRLPGTLPMKTVHAALESHNVSVSVRGKALRVAPHVYNDQSDLDALVAAIRALVSY